MYRKKVTVTQPTQLVRDRVETLSLTPQTWIILKWIMLSSIRRAIREDLLFILLFIIYIMHLTNEQNTVVETLDSYDDPSVQWANVYIFMFITQDNPDIEVHILDL